MMGDKLQKVTAPISDKPNIATMSILEIVFLYYVEIR